jgi:hypothetical protein
MSCYSIVLVMEDIQENRKVYIFEFVSDIVHMRYASFGSNTKFSVKLFSPIRVELRYPYQILT